MADQHLLTAVQRLTVSNTSCEALCYDLWLRLIKMIVFLERRIPSKIGDKSTLVALDRLRNWQMPSKGNHECRKAVHKSKLCGRHRSELWYSCLNDRLLFQMNRKFRKVHLFQCKTEFVVLSLIRWTVKMVVCCFLAGVFYLLSHA